MTEASFVFTADRVIVESDHREAVLSVEFEAGGTATLVRLMLLFACDEAVAIGSPYHIEFQQGGVILSHGQIHALTLGDTGVQIEWAPATRQEGTVAIDVAGLETHRLRVLLPSGAPVLTLLRQLIPARVEVR